LTDTDSITVRYFAFEPLRMGIACMFQTGATDYPYNS